MNTSVETEVGLFHVSSYWIFLNNDCNICSERFLLTDRNSDMTILDIGLMTGFEPDTTELDKVCEENVFHKDFVDRFDESRV